MGVWLQSCTIEVHGCVVAELYNMTVYAVRRNRILEAGGIVILIDSRCTSFPPVKLMACGIRTVIVQHAHDVECTFDTQVKHYVCSM